jgi:hypothetical protein
VIFLETHQQNGWQAFDDDGSAVVEAAAGSSSLMQHLDLVLHEGGNCSIKEPSAT